MSFVNPFGHVQKVEHPTRHVLKIRGREVEFNELGAGRLAQLADRFPALRAQIEGAPAPAMTDDEEREMTVAIIAAATTPADLPLDQLREVEASIAGLRQIERDVAMGLILQASFPDIEKLAGEGDDRPLAGKASTNRQSRRAASSKSSKIKPRT